MLPFEFEYQPGRPVSEQLVFSVKKALASGVLSAGDRFPSVRRLSRELRINPNTAQKVVAQLTQAGILEIEPGIGARIRRTAAHSTEASALILAPKVEELAIEAKRLGLKLGQLEQQLAQAWKKLNPDQ